MVNYGRVYQC
ncbi:MAG: hypothetical protein EZS28_051737, partial [Streblomastix strix]